MSRLHKRLIVVFCLGVLLCGIGVGVAVTEFESLAYVGKLRIGEPDIRTEILDVEFEAGEEVQDVYIWALRMYDTEIQTDNSVPRNTVRFRVTYNTKRIVPLAYWSEEEGVVFSCSRVAKEDEMALMMEAKDAVLQNLKKGKLVSVEVPDLESVEVLVNTADVEDVRLVY